MSAPVTGRIRRSYLPIWRLQSGFRRRIGIYPGLRWYGSLSPRPHGRVQSPAGDHEQSSHTIVGWNSHHQRCTAHALYLYGM